MNFPHELKTLETTSRPRHRRRIRTGGGDLNEFAQAVKFSFEIRRLNTHTISFGRLTVLDEDALSQP
jgi:hypothetical protein